MWNNIRVFCKHCGLNYNADVYSECPRCYNRGYTFGEVC